MCKWFCTSTGPSTSLKCLHCGAGYCGACLHGEGGKMESLIKCSSCGKKPRTQGAAKRGTWKAAPGPDATSSSVGNESEVGVKNDGTGTRAVSNDPVQEKLAGVFDQYCKFAPASTALDNVKWFKCVSELDLVDNKSLTRADVDLIFTKVKAKGERRINFQGFRDALSMVARKKNSVNDGEGDDVELLGKLLAGKLNVSNQVTASTGDDGKSDAPASPTAAGGEKKSPAKKKATTKLKTGAKSPGGVKSPGAKPRSPKASGGAGGNTIFDKLTDASQYTGSHKHRFDSDGKGRGLAGRDSLSKGGVGGAYHGGAVNDLSQIMRTNLHQAPAKGSSPNASKETEMTKSSISGGSPKKSPKKKKDGPSIFDKLTDASQYTGAHKHRFDSTGKGRGLAGRDSGGVERGGKVNDLSQITNRK